MTALLLSALLAGTAAPAAAKCDAKPFTLNKPAAAQPVKAPEPVKKTAEAAKPAPAKPKPTPLADCKAPAKKG